MVPFLKKITKPKKSDSRTWVYIAYDQLSDKIGLLKSIPYLERGIILIESFARWKRRPYHKQKIALVLANMRAFALEQQSKGALIDYHITEDSEGTCLEACF